MESKKHSNISLLLINNEIKNIKLKLKPPKTGRFFCVIPSLIPVICPLLCASFGNYAKREFSANKNAIF